MRNKLLIIGAVVLAGLATAGMFLREKIKNLRKDKNEGTLPE